MLPIASDSEALLSPDPEDGHRARRNNVALWNDIDGAMVVIRKRLRVRVGSAHGRIRSKTGERRKPKNLFGFRDALRVLKAICANFARPEPTGNEPSVAPRADPSSEKVP